MKVQQLPNAAHLRPQKPAAADVPHVTIEPNTTCNIRCKFCYAIEHPMVKPLAQVIAEIDLAGRKRRLDAISLVGGEPTLHPEIVAIVQEIKARGLVCNLLTNGVRFLYHGDTALLDALKEAGLDRVMLHVDSGQAHVHGDVRLARQRLFALMESRELTFGLSKTLYRGEEHELAGILKEATRWRWFDGALVTLAMDVRHLLDRDPAARRMEPDLGQIAQNLQDTLGLAPSAYLPSSLDDDEVSWLMYFYWINAETGETFALSPELNRAMRWLYRARAGREFFAEKLLPDQVAAALGVASVAELLLHPGRAAELTRLLSHSADALRFQYLMIQASPRWNAEKGGFQICWQCPDATIRNGKLTPVCLGGLVNPLGGGEPEAPLAIREAVFGHLGEPVG